MSVASVNVPLLHVFSVVEHTPFTGCRFVNLIALTIVPASLVFT